MSNESSGMVTAFAVIILIFFAIKFFAGVSIDTGRNYNVKMSTAIVGRFVNLLLYIALFSIVSLFNSVVFFVIIEVAVGLYLLVVGIMCAAQEDVADYFSVENVFIAGLESNFDEYQRNRKTRKNTCNNINKRIHDYTKRTVIG